MATTAVLAAPRGQVAVLLIALTAAAVVFVQLLGFGGRQAALLVIGLALGMALYHGAFGFAFAYRRALVDRDITGVIAQLVMLAAAIVLFAPLLAGGSVLGRPVTGALAPVSISMAFGAFLFGIGMQLAGACASGTLYTSGGGSTRMLVVLVLFCLGGFWASLDIGWWQRLPGIGTVSLGRALGWGPAAVVQLAALAVIYLTLRAIGGRARMSLGWPGGFSWDKVVRGPWPLLLTALALAGLNWLTLLVAGHAWSITWGLTLWAAKAAVALGWDPASSAFWTGGFPEAALSRSILADSVSVMNIGILLGALIAAALAGKVAPTVRIPARSLIAAVLGGLAMGYGARLAYGCNIGAFFSGVASGSLHGWVWIAAALPGVAIGAYLRPLFGLPR